MRTIAFALLLLPLAVGCASRNRLTAGHGRAYRQAFARQVANPDAGKRPIADKGLDPQEAAVISSAYRASLAPEGKSTQQEQLLLIAPSVQKGGGRPGDYMPPASVPPESR